MARIRSIKPEFWTSPDIGDVTRDARLLFIGLWNQADDAGRIEALPIQLKADIFPYDDDITLNDLCGWVNELVAQGLVRLYAKGRRAFLQVTGWEHQRIDRPSQPRCPDPDECVQVDKLTPTIHRDLDAPSQQPRAALAAPSRESSDRTVGALDRRNVGTSDLLVAADAPTVDDLFDQFWDAYPRGQGGKPGGDGSKKAARQKWRRLKPEQRDACLQSVGNYRDHCEAGTFAAHASTWLNQERWEQWQTPAEDPSRPPEVPKCPDCHHELVGEHDAETCEFFQREAS